MKLQTTLFALLCGVFAFSQTYEFTVHPNNRVASVKIPQVDYDAWVTNDYFSGVDLDGIPGGPRSYEKIENLSQAIYTHFEDDFDFIFLVLNEPTKPTTIGYYGKNRPIRNNTLGIGVDNNPLDRGLQHGSPNRLKSILHLPALSYLENGPSLHELLHLWGNMAILAGNAAINPQNGQLISFNSIGHWGFTGHNNFGDGGQLGGFDQGSLVENADGSFTMDSFGLIANGGNQIKYSEMELYLMGLMELNEVQPFDVFSNITEFSESNGQITIKANNRETFTNSYILQNYSGPRVPSYTDSQKDFTALVIVLTAEDLTPSQWQVVDDQAYRFSLVGDDGQANRNNFWEATRGRGTLNVDLSTSVLSNETFELANFEVYPNPANDFINVVDIENVLSNNINVSLTNVLGQNVVSELFYEKSDNRLKIDTKNISSGIYILSIKDDGKTVLNKRIIIN